MKNGAMTGAVAIAAALGIVLSGCGSDAKNEASSSSSATSSATSTEATPAPPPANQTVAQYVTSDGIKQTVANSGVAGAPNVNLPIPEGWVPLREGLPAGSYGGIGYTGPDADADYPPTIFAYLSRLDGPADPARILELAPNDLRSLAGYVPIAEGEPSKLGGFDGYQLSGTALIQDLPRFIAQKTVVIPGINGGLYLLQLNAYSTPEQQGLLGEALGRVDAETTIAF